MKPGDLLEDKSLEQYFHDNEDQADDLFEHLNNLMLLKLFIIGDMNLKKYFVPIIY